MSEKHPTFNEVEKKFNELLKAEKHSFSSKRKRAIASDEQGVYIIQRGEDILHVGRTTNGTLTRRINNHRTGKSSFKMKYLIRYKIILDENCSFQFVEITKPKLRAFVEAYASGKLCPMHIGTGKKHKE